MLILVTKGVTAMKVKRFAALAVGGFIFAGFLVSADAAPAGRPVQADQPQGIKNLRKVMQARFDREKKMQTVRGKAQAKKHQAKGAR